MNERFAIGGLEINKSFYEFVENELLVGLDITPSQYWAGFEALSKEHSGENVSLLKKREGLQSRLDEWHRENPGQIQDLEAYSAFLGDIGYMVEEGPDFTINSGTLDTEIATLSGPQLVVPVSNARYALNAANARWGSLYDALYGSDIIDWTDEERDQSGYCATRGDRVVAWVRDFLDESVPLVGAKHRDVVRYTIAGGIFKAILLDGETAELARPDQYCGYKNTENSPQAILLKHNGLHLEIQFDPETTVGGRDKADVSDIWVEAALSVIMDCEDSVAAVSPEEKTDVYRNWLGLMQGTLAASFNKGGRPSTRTLNADRSYQAKNGQAFLLRGRSLMLVRNVGHLMTSDLVLMDGMEVFEGLLDAYITATAALHDLRGLSKHRNSTGNVVYIVKPKMHGPEEVAFTAKVFTSVEDLLGLPHTTLKMGIMDEERRTSLNLKECIRAAKDRVFFINTGFLDRTGDEIHSVMEAGPVVLKGDMKDTTWIKIYEVNNVHIGLAAGFLGKAQIGKGMWAKPDEMAEMMVEKINHPLSGATTAWVPSPTAAVLHSLHYHLVDVAARQRTVALKPMPERIDLLHIPVHSPVHSEEVWSQKVITDELRQNVQSILGYVVRWVDMGVGCSKVPDISDIGLMEDRATLRISSQHIANWLRHGVCSPDQVMRALREMAVKVDEQNRGETGYQPMAPNFEASYSFQAAHDLIFKGCELVSGYTEPVLNHYRKMVITR